MQKYAGGNERKKVEIQLEEKDIDAREGKF